MNRLREDRGDSTVTYSVQEFLTQWLTEIGMRNKPRTVVIYTLALNKFKAAMESQGTVNMAAA